MYAFKDLKCCVQDDLNEQNMQDKRLLVPDMILCSDPKANGNIQLPYKTTSYLQHPISHPSLTAVILHQLQFQFVIFISIELAYLKSHTR